MNLIYWRALEVNDFAGVDEAVSASGDWHDAALAVSSLHEDVPTGLQAIIAALDYHFPVENGSESPFGPMWQMDGRVYPMPLSMIPDETLEIWKSALGILESSLIRSRIADLLWVRKAPGGHQYARIACDEYHQVSIAARSSIMTLAIATKRSLELAVELNYKDRFSVLVETAQEQAKKLLKNHPDAPGASLRIVGELVRQAKKFKVQEVIAAILEQAASVYSSQIFILSSVRELQVSLVRNDPQKVRDLHALHVEEWINEAAGSQGIVRLAHLERAREVAAAGGLSDEIGRVRSLIELSPVADSELSVIESVTAVKTADIERFENQFFTGTELAQFMLTFGQCCPLPHEHSTTESQTRKFMDDHPVQFLATKIILNAEGLPVKYLRRAEEHFENAVVQNQVANIQIWLLLADRILQRALSQFAPSSEELEARFTNELISAEVATVFARGVKLYEEGRYDDCVCVVVPRLETVVREMARNVGMVIYSEPQNETPGGYKALGHLISSLESKMPEHYRRYLMASIGDPMGINLRNRLCHGLMVQATRSEAVLALHLAIMFSSLQGSDGLN